MQNHFLTIRSATLGTASNTVAAIVEMNNHTEQMILPLDDLCNILNVPTHLHGIDPILMYVPIELEVILKGTEIHHMELVDQKDIEESYDNDNEDSTGISNASTVDIEKLKINSSQESDDAIQEGKLQCKVKVENKDSDMDADEIDEERDGAVQRREPQYKVKEENKDSDMDADEINE